MRSRASKRGMFDTFYLVITHSFLKFHEFSPLSNLYSPIRVTILQAPKFYQWLSYLLIVSICWFEALMFHINIYRIKPSALRTSLSFSSQLLSVAVNLFWFRVYYIHGEWYGTLIYHWDQLFNVIMQIIVQIFQFCSLD